MYDFEAVLCWSRILLRYLGLSSRYGVFQRRGLFHGFLEVPLSDWEKILWVMCNLNNGCKIQDI
jgi:hypothetical protein